MKMSPLEILRLLQKKFRFSSEESKSITSIPSWRERGSWLIYAWPGLKSRGESSFSFLEGVRKTRGSHNESKESEERSRFSRTRNDVNSAEIEMRRSFCAFIRFARDMEKRRRRSNREQSKRKPESVSLGEISEIAIIRRIILTS